MNAEENKEHIRLFEKVYANTFWPLTGSKYFYFENTKTAEEITKKCRNFLNETVVYGIV